MKSIRIALTTLLVIVFVAQSTALAQDPLPSWNEGPAKRASNLAQDQLQTARLDSWGPGLWGFPE